MGECMKKIAKRCLTVLGVIVLVSLGMSLARAYLARDAIETGSWRTAPRHSAGIAPDPVKFRNTAIVQIYAAPTYGWRGLVAVHPWIIFKHAGQARYTRYEVIGWGSGRVIRRNANVADGLWYGTRPHLLVDQRGPQVEKLIGQIQAAIKTYPFPYTYHAYPGPNSNTFMAHIGREVPGLGLDMPANAIGKDYRPITHPVGLSSTGRGVQASLWGLLGVNLGLREGIEINVLALDFGIDFHRPALRLPFFGRLGMDDTARRIEK